MLPAIEPKAVIYRGQRQHQYAAGPSKLCQRLVRLGRVGQYRGADVYHGDGKGDEYQQPALGTRNRRRDSVDQWQILSRGQCRIVTWVSRALRPRAVQ